MDTQPTNAAPSIWVVDDQANILLLLTLILKPLYKTLSATSAAEMFNMLGSLPLPDLILLDIMMPDMDGVDIIKKLKRMPETREIPVIFVTALIDQATKEKAYALGAADLITKPFNRTTLLARCKIYITDKHNKDYLHLHPYLKETENKSEK